MFNWVGFGFGYANGYRVVYGWIINPVQIKNWISALSIYLTNNQMNHKLRYFGLYRPWGCKPNVFNFFYTRHPALHMREQENIYSKAEDEAFFEIAHLMGYNVTPSTTIYSQKPYPNYQKLYRQILNYFKKQGNEIHFVGIDYSQPVGFVFPGKYVLFNEQQLAKTINFDEIIDEIDSRK